MAQEDLNRIVKIKGEQSVDDPLTFVLSTESKDRHGDIIRANGWVLDQFKKNPIALFGHSHSSIVGTWEKVRVEGKKLLGELRLAKSGTSPLVDQVRSLIEQRILRSVSVGFQPLEAEPLDKDKPWAGYEYLKSMLHEVSLVAVPANPQAIQVAKAAMSPELVDVLFTESGGGLDNIKTGEIYRGGFAARAPTPNLDRVLERLKSMNIDLEA